MSNQSITIKNLLIMIKELKRESHYRALKVYIQSLKRKESLNGKESFILRGATSLLRLLEADRRSKSLGLTPFIPYDERKSKSKEIQGNYLSWDRSVSLFGRE